MGLFRGLRSLLEGCQDKQDEHGEWKELKQEHPLSPGHWCSTCEINEKIHRKMMENIEKSLKEKEGETGS